MHWLSLHLLEKHRFLADQILYLQEYKNRNIFIRTIFAFEFRWNISGPNCLLNSTIIEPMWCEYCNVNYFDCMKSHRSKWLCPSFKFIVVWHDNKRSTGSGEKKHRAIASHKRWVSEQISSNTTTQMMCKARERRERYPVLKKRMHIKLSKMSVDIAICRSCTTWL